MPKKTFKELKTAGERFVQFLKDSAREAISSKEVLKQIYNNEFRNRDGTKQPNFSSMLYVLRCCDQAEVTRNSVSFGKVKKQYLTDQYRRPKNNAGEEPPTPGQEPGDGPPPRRGRAKHRAKLICKKHGVDISSDHDQGNGCIRFPVAPREAKTISIWVQNSGTEEVVFRRYKPLRRHPAFTFEDSHMVYQRQPLTLQPGEKYEIQAHCLTQEYGYCPVTMLFEFTQEQAGPFSIWRFLSAVAKSQLEKDLGPSAPYRPYQENLRKPRNVTTEDGVPPSDYKRPELEYEVLLGRYEYPGNLKRLVTFLDAGRTSNKEEIAQLRSTLTAALQFENYSQKFQLLLHLEEIQMEVDICRYDMEDVHMVFDRNRKLLVLEAPGVAENRPSVLKGDHLFATLSEERGQPQVVEYKGYAYAVELDRVKLGFSTNLLNRFIDKLKFDVRFTFGRLPLRLQHRAVLLAKERDLRHLLFPSFSYDASLLPADHHLSLFDRNLETNEQQAEAVRQVVMGTSRPAPYLIFGPPGTGKTVTVIEAIKQVLRCFSNSHVLACAPSNSASDLLCQRLIQSGNVDKSAIYRMNASSRDFRQIPEDIKPCCNWDDAQGCHVYPKKEKLMKYRIIITTLVTAGRLASAEFSPGHFTHVFIDECGHAVEPESMIAIAGILAAMDQKTNPNGGQVVLVGDPQQLGPILRSPLAIDHGLGVSLLERLMRDNPLYGKGEGSYNPQFVTKLLRNYRSHAAILRVPNERFYERELQEHADRFITHSYCAWQELPKQDFPIIFHGVSGEDQREGNSPSFFNTSEIDMLVGYLRKLLLEGQGKKGRSRLSPKECGIISPYRKQVEKIRKAITSLDRDLKGLPDIKDLKVGSVEEFQGQERRVVLISTVRSCSEYLGMDEEFRLGFLKNPKRFNVAITRAKALLIIVGNPFILRKDPHWNAFLQYCVANGAYRGHPYEEESTEEETLAAEFHSLNLSSQAAGNSLGESHIQQQVEFEWRHEH
uniref:RNA helicase n=1 Tax=Sphenodon punctatus TaxID=8508 RepID=A0A8D0HA50_SPHPU